MKIEGTEAAAQVVERAKRDRRGALVFTIGTGCCESTAPFLYEDFWPGPDQEVVGEVAGVPIYAPEYLRSMYPANDGVTIDVEHGLISTASPIGRALLNKEEGDEVTVTTPNGSRRFEVVKLLTIHDE